MRSTPFHLDSKEYGKFVRVQSANLYMSFIFFKITDLSRYSVEQQFNMFFRSLVWRGILGRKIAQLRRELA
jgi:hypothetical protein